jgi:hypothetical protein
MEQSSDGGGTEALLRKHRNQAEGCLAALNITK